VRELSRKDDPDEFASGVLDDGTRFLSFRRGAIHRSGVRPGRNPPHCGVSIRRTECWMSESRGGSGGLWRDEFLTLGVGQARSHRIWALDN